MFRLFTAALAATTFQGAALAQNQPAPPPCADDIHRDFDFWIGEWDVFDVNDNKIGENSIQVELDGCLLVERWNSANNIPGSSYNFVDFGTKKWRQVWVSSWGTIDYDGGLNDAGEMVLEGELAAPNGNVVGFRGTWALQEDGSVKQSFDQQNAETKEWTNAFVGIYRKKTE